MWDTVRAQVRCELDPGQLLEHGFHEHRDRVIGAEGVVKEVVAYDLHLPGESPHYLAYLPPLRSDESDPAGCLKVETSLPKALRGENVTLLSPDDVGSALDVVSNRLGDRLGVDVGDFGAFDVRGRVDAVFSWRTKQVDDYLHALKQMNLGRHVSQSVDRDATVYWRNRQRVIRCYDKGKESGLAIGKDLLRFEVQLNHAKGELRRHGVGSTKLREILNWKTASGILGFYLDEMGADLMIADDERLVKHLLKVCRPAKARRLIGSMVMQRVFSRDELVRAGLGRKTFYRDRADLRAMGVSEGSARSGILPSLRLPGRYTGEPFKLD